MGHNSIAMRRGPEEGAGVILYLRQEGRDIGLYAKMQAYNLQDQGLDTMDANLALGLPADARTYEMAAEMLLDLGVSRIRLMTNNPLKRQAMIDAGIDVVERAPTHRWHMRAQSGLFGHEGPKDGAHARHRGRVTQGENE